MHAADIVEVSIEAFLDKLLHMYSGCTTSAATDVKIRTLPDRVCGLSHAKQGHGHGLFISE